MSSSPLDPVAEPRASRTRPTTRMTAALVRGIRRLANHPDHVEVIARVNGDQCLVLMLPVDEMERRGLMVGAWIKLEHHPGGVALA